MPKPSVNIIVLDPIGQNHPAINKNLCIAFVFACAPFPLMYNSIGSSYLPCVAPKASWIVYRNHKYSSTAPASYFY